MFGCKATETDFDWWELGAGVGREDEAQGGKSREVLLEKVDWRERLNAKDQSSGECWRSRSWERGPRDFGVCRCRGNSGVSRGGSDRENWGVIDPNGR